MLIGIDASRALRAKRTGTERYALEIIRHLLALPEAGRHTWRLYVEQPASAELFGPPGQARVEFCLLPAARLWTHRTLAREVMRRPPEVLFIPAHVLPLVLPAQRLPPSVVTIHDLGYHYFPDAHGRWQRLYLEWSTRWSARAATRLIAVSQATADDLTRFYATPPTKIDVVYEAVQTDEAQSSPATLFPGLQRPYLLYVGTLQPRKNLARLIQAFAHFREQSKLDWDLVLVGSQGWGDEPLASLISSLCLLDRIHLLGYVPDTELSRLWRGAQFFCFPSLFEGFGLPVLEAHYYGVPVMTSHNSALPEIAGDAALLVDPTDVEAIAEAMLHLSQDEALRQRLIAAGYENVKRFSWAKAAQETLAVLEKAARERK